MSTKSLIIIPTYNESENVLDIIAAVLELDNRFHVLIVDDNSPDGTASLVTEAQKTENRIHLLKRAGKLGLGTAYLEGFSYGLENGFE
ncbi:MAG TPA: glycosyltransferase, partial [Saprospiraceae bacterium]|nr:glycosyltransferase [Saprospiraceae bacterium]